MSEQNKAKALPDRNEIEEASTWRLEDIFQTDAEWEKEFQAIKELLPKLTEFKGNLVTLRTIYLRHCNMKMKFQCD